MTAKAVLQIDADTSGLLRAFGQARAQAKVTADGIAREFVGRAGGAYRASGKAAEDSARRASTVQVREAQRVVSDYLRGESQKRRAAELTAQKRAEAERKATEIARDEAHKRGLTAEQEAQLRARTMQGLTRVFIAEERKRTQAARREEQERRRDRERSFGTVSRVMGSAGGATLQTAQAAHGMIQDARQRRAAADRVLGNALRNAGASRSDTTAARTRVQQFAEQTGMSFADVADALALGQGRGSALEARPGQTRAQALESSLATIRTANAEGVNAGQLLAARGRLGAAGLTGEHLNRAIMMTIGAAQRGSVEVEQLITEGLPGASRLMSARIGALGAGATNEQRQQAALTAYQESVALQEVGASTGRRAGNTANVLAAVNNALMNPRRQEQILTNIRTAEAQANVNDPAGRARRDALVAFREQMFERDPTRTGNAMRLRAGASPLEFSARLAQVTGGDAAAASNILAGTGHGNPQSFQANWRDLVSFLGGRTATGQTGGQRVVEMMGASLTPEALAQHQTEVESDALAQLTRDQERHDNALVGNTNALNNLSNTVASFTAQNPLASKALPALGAAGLTALGGAKSVVAGAGLAFLGSRATLSTGRALGVGPEIGAGESLTRAALDLVPGVGTATGVAGGLADVARTATDRSAQQALLALPDRIVAALTGNPLTVTPHAAAVAEQNARASQGQTPRAADR